MAEKQLEYLYRYRSWDNNVWYGSRRDEFTAEELAAGWGDWGFIDEQKYNEIVAYIGWERPCHYQAEKLLVTVMNHDSFDPVEYIAREKISRDKSRQEYQNSLQKKVPENGSALSMSSSQSSMSVVGSYSLLNLAEVVVRSVGDGISSTFSVAGDCVEAIGEGISGMCD